MASTEEPTDEELIDLFKSGGSSSAGPKGRRNSPSWALEKLVDRHRERVVRHAARLLGDVDEAYDVAQEVFIAALDAMRSWRYEALLTSWLHRTTVNISLSHMRRIKRAPVPSADLPDVANGRREDTSDLARAVRKACQELAPRQREIVTLRIFERMSVGDIASLLGTNPNNVRVSFHKAVSAIREKLKRRGFFGG